MGRLYENWQGVKKVLETYDQKFAELRDDSDDESAIDLVKELAGSKEVS